MTKKTTLLSCLLVFIMAVIASWYYHLQQDKKLDTGICSTTIIVYRNNIRANLTLDFMYRLKNYTGVVGVNGTYYKDDKIVGSIRREVYYTWSEYKDIFHFHSVKVNKIINDQPLSDEVVSEILPDFFVYPDKNIAYSIRPQGENSFLFTVGTRPIFLCYR